MKNVCKYLQVEKIQTTPYHPQSNGMIERSHRVFKDTISHYVAKNQQDWDNWVPYVLMAYRFNTHRSTGYSPFFLLYGRDPVLPFDDILRPVAIKYDIDHNYVSELMNRLNNAYVTVRQNLSECKEKQAIQYNKTSKNREFSLGDLVYLHDPTTQVGLSKKLGKPWTGPYRVIEVKGPVTYKIRLLNGRKELVVHANRLKPCQIFDENFEIKIANKDDNDIDATNDQQTEQTQDVFGINPRDVTLAIAQGMGVPPHVQIQEAEEGPDGTMGTIFRDGVRVSTRPHRPLNDLLFQSSIDVILL